MAHFAVLVITKTGTESEVEKLLAPYSAQLKIEEYNHKCSCGEYRANKEAREQTEKQMGKTFENLRSEFSAKHKDRSAEWILSGECGMLWKDHTKQFIDLENKINKTLDKSPDKKCEECNGTGTYKSRQNPQSRWDWYSIGGRWNGKFFGKNQIQIEELLKHKFTITCVTPDGQWHGRGEMGWFGFVHDKVSTRTWHSSIIEHLSKYKDHVGVLVDCHI